MPNVLGSAQEAAMSLETSCDAFASKLAGIGRRESLPEKVVIESTVCV